MEDPKGAIYAPPAKSGLPFLVVTFEDGGLKAKPTQTRAEARQLLAEGTRRAKSAVVRAAALAKAGS
jgi:hypothetical protein